MPFWPTPLLRLNDASVNNVANICSAVINPLRTTYGAFIARRPFYGVFAREPVMHTMIQWTALWCPDMNAVSARFVPSADISIDMSVVKTVGYVNRPDISLASGGRHVLSNTYAAIGA